MTSPTPQQRATTRWRPSPIFLGLILVSVVSGIALWNWVGYDGTASGGIGIRLIAFVFVIASWVITLCLHEFGHAIVAYRNGDLSIAHRGYLTLDPLKYTHVMFSIVLPLIFVLLGGIGLPGGAVFVDRRALRTRFAHSAVSAAGPLMNVAVAIVLAIALAFHEATTPFWAAIAFLLFLQVTAAILNLLPIPGLDGYGILEPYLPRTWASQAARIAPFAILGLFAILWIPALNSAFFAGINGILSLLGVPAGYVGLGYGLFQFWR
ncbi:MAG: site-2 protease family protein [Salinibacterium sp.]|nr:site-2 protease family protein [Salinibacterium sp.]